MDHDMKKKIIRTVGKNTVKDIPVNVPKFTRDINESVRVLRKGLEEKENQLIVLRKAINDGNSKKILKTAEDMLMLDHNIVTSYQTALAKLEAHLSDVLIAIETYPRINSATLEEVPEQKLIVTVGIDNPHIDYTEIDLSELTYAQYLFRLFRYEEYISNEETKNVEDKIYGLDEFFTNRMTIIRKKTINEEDNK